MKVRIVRNGEHGSAFCDRCFVRHIVNGNETPCAVERVDDGSPDLTITIVGFGEVHTYLLTPDQQQMIREPSIELAQYEVPLP